MKYIASIWYFTGNILQLSTTQIMLALSCVKVKNYHPILIKKNGIYIHENEMYNIKFDICLYKSSYFRV